MVRVPGAWGAGRGLVILFVLAAVGWWAVMMLGDDPHGGAAGHDGHIVEAAPEVEPPRWEAGMPVAASVPAEVEPLAPPEDALGDADELPAPPVAGVEAPLATLRVYVVTPEGRPVEGAEVTLDTSEQARELTDAQGQAAFEVTSGTSVRAAARHEAFRFATARADVPAEPDVTTDLVLVLERAVSVCVRIESHLGLPVGGARVGFRETEKGVQTLPQRFTRYRPDSLARFHRRERFEGQYHETRVTGTDGRCCASGVRPGYLTLSVEAPGFVRVDWHQVEVVEPGGDLGVIRLEPATTLRGLVLDTEGAAVPGALVESWWPGESPQLFTDDEGRFSIGRVREGARHVPLQVTHETRGHFHDDRWPVTTDEQVVTLHPSLVARLRLVDADTRLPLEGRCKVTLLMPERTMLLMALEIEQRKTLELHQGELDVDPVYAFGTTLRFEVPGYARTEVPVASVVEAAGERFEVALVREGKLSVRVLDSETGLPMSKVKFSAVSWPRERPVQKDYHLVPAEFHASAGVYLIDMSVFTAAADREVSLTGGDDGYHWFEPLPVFRDGARVIGDWVEVRLKRE